MSDRGPSADWRSRSIAARARGSACRRGGQPNAVGNPRPDPRLRAGAAPQDRRPCQRPRARGSAATRWWTGARLSGWLADCAVVWRRSRRGKASRDCRREGFLPTSRNRGLLARSPAAAVTLARSSGARAVLGVYVVMTQMVVIKPCLRNRRAIPDSPVAGTGFPTRGVSTGPARWERFLPRIDAARLLLGHHFWDR